MNRKGVCYDVGRVITGENQRPDFDAQIVRRELEIIRRDLNCNAVRICGQDVERVIAAAEIALDLGLEAWLSPEPWGQELSEALDYLDTAARAAEAVRQKAPGRVVLSVGTEATLFMRGILPHGPVIDLMRNPLKFAWTMRRLKAGAYHAPLNHFLTQASSVARSIFHGPITYASVPIEAVDWTLFDIISIDYYRGKKNRTTYGQRLDRYLTVGKPVVVTEVGCCTYQGAEDKGGRGFFIFDRRYPGEDRIKPGYVRDEELQAREVSDMLTVLDAVGVDGAFVFVFSSPTLVHRADPLRDFDLGSYSLVKTLPDGAHGTTYPDMPWEPKQSFHAVADTYSAT